MVWKEVGKWVKETGEKMVGRGQEVKFRNDVQEFADSHGVTVEEAEKRVFADYLGNVGTEIRMRGCIDSHSEEWRSFEASLNELLSSDERAKLERDANNPGVWRAIHPAPVTGTDYARMERYFRGKFAKQLPKHEMVRRSAEDTKILDGLGRRVDHDLAPLATTPDKLSVILGARPEIGADIGKMMQAKREMEKIERVFGADVRFKEIWEKDKEKMREILGERLGKGVREFLSDVFKGGAEAVSAAGKVEKVPGAIVRLSKALIKGIGKATIGGGKILLILGKDLALKIHKELKKL
jgi:hypothetical protein